MSEKNKDIIYAGSFNCRIPLILLETCAKCAKDGKCRNRCKLSSILKGKKSLSYKKPD